MNPLYKTNSPHRFQNAPYMNNITEAKLYAEYIILQCRKQYVFKLTINANQQLKSLADSVS